ncbi:MAG: hypothetical protein ACKPKO_30365, partial [Candidatus Fonsibacter sp.]
MWSTDKLHKGRLLDQSSTMDQRPHENPVLVAKGHMQYTWFRSILQEQYVNSKDHIKLKAHIAVADGMDFDAL